MKPLDLHRFHYFQCGVGCTAIPTWAEFKKALAHDACRKIIKQSFFGGDA